MIDFYHNSVKVESVELNILNSPDLNIQTHSIGLLPQWDALKLGISGRDGANLAVLRIKENEQEVFDLMARTGCDSVWLDGNFGENAGCYFGSASFDREVHLGNSGNFQLDFCTGESLDIFSKLKLYISRIRIQSSFLKFKDPHPLVCNP